MTDWEYIVKLTEEKDKYKKIIELLRDLHLYESDDYGVHYKVVNIDKLLWEVGIGND